MTGSPAAEADSNTSYVGVSACEADDAGDQASSKSRSPRQPDIAATSCCCEIGRAIIDVTVSTGSPSPSASSTETADGPDGAIRARTADAPAACSDTPCHENGNATTVLPACGDRRRVQRRVEQHRVHTESADAAGRLRQRHLGEELVAATPQRGQTLERRAVLVAALRQPLVAVGHVDRGRALGRPHRQIGSRLDRSRTTRCPSRGSSRRNPLSPWRTPTDSRWPDSSAAPTTTCTATEPDAGNSNGDCNVSSSTARAADFVAGADRQLDEARTGEHHHAVDGVIGQPALGGRRQPTRQHHPAGVRQFDHRAQQRVLAGAEPQAGRVDRRAIAGEPKALSLKGIRRQLDEAGRR